MSSSEVTQLTDEEIRAAIEVEQVVRMWGQDCTITPRFVAESLGDGQQWIWLSPTMKRPNYYMIRVDSGWDIDSAFDEESEGEIIEHHDEILQTIEAEYGCSEEEMNSEEGPTFPYIQIDGGSSWGAYDFERKVRR